MKDLGIALCRLLAESSLFGLLILIAVFAVGTAHPTRRFRFSAADRCLLWQWAIAMLAAAPVISGIFPAHRVLAVPSTISNTFVAASAQPRTSVLSSLPSSTESRPNPDQDLNGVSAEKVTSPPSVLDPQAVITTQSGADAVVDRRGLALTGVALLWLIVAAVLLLDAAMGQIRLHRMTRRCTVVQSGPVFELNRLAACKLGLKEPPALMMAADAMPMAWGWRRPTILLPESAVAWPADTLLAALLHEMSHICRRDWILQRLARFVGCFFWFHPLAWIGVQAIKREAELACDDSVINAGVSAPDYAERLLEIVQMMKYTRPVSKQFPSVALTNSAQIQGRLKAILDPERRRSGVRRTYLIGIAAATLMTAPIAMLHLFAQTANSPVADHSSKTANPQSAVKATKSAAATSNPKRNAGSVRESEYKAILARLDQQSRLIAALQADHKHETEALKMQIETLRRQNEIAKDANRAGTDQLALLEAKRRDVLANQRPGESASVSEAEKRKLTAALLDRETSRSEAELKARRAELNTLDDIVKRKREMYKAGVLSSADLDEATLALQRAEIDMQKRAAELAQSNEAKVDHQVAELEKRKAEIDTLNSSVAKQRDLNRAGLNSQAEIDAAIAKLERAIAELRKRQAELSKKP